MVMILIVFLFVDKYIAIASLSEPVRIFLIDVDNSESIENPLELTSYYDEIIFNDISDVFHIKIWRPGMYDFTTFVCLITRTRLR